MGFRSYCGSRRGFVALFAWFCPLALSCGLLDEVIPRKETATPVVNLALDLENPVAVSPAFEFLYPGEFSVNLRLDLRHGPGSGLATDIPFSGTFEIAGEASATRIERDFEGSLRQNEIGIQLGRFDTEDFDSGNHFFAIRFDRLTPEFRATYENMRVFVRKELKYPVLD
jgi:hypothetical protein